MLKRFSNLLFFVLALGSAQWTFAYDYDNPPACQYGVGQCKLEYVMREAYDGDKVCVPRSSRQQAKEDNDNGPSRKEPGSENCKFGWVWREASKDDRVCATGQIRDRSAVENREAASRIDPKCTVRAVCTFNCNAKQKDCLAINDGQDCKKERAQCMGECQRELRMSTPH